MANRPIDRRADQREGIDDLLAVLERGWAAARDDGYDSDMEVDLVGQARPIGGQVVAAAITGEQVLVHHETAEQIVLRRRRDVRLLEDLAIHLLLTPEGVQ